jgi:NAD(P)-dependent dehydrogenase (short-subunit alcohol dehydrogenase family)
MTRTLITGASRGLGRALVRALRSRGHHVIATARNLNDLDDLDADIKLALDVTSAESVVNAIAECGAPDVVINNAAYSVAGPLEAVETDAFERLLNINVLGPHRLIAALLPGMRKRGSGLIVNISSGTAHGAPPLQGAYAVSKAALNLYSQALRMEVAPFGVRVLSVEPPGMKTDLLDAQPTYSRAGYEAYERRGAELNATRPELDVDRVANKIALAISEEPLSERIGAAEFLSQTR